MHTVFEKLRMWSLTKVGQYHTDGIRVGLRCRLRRVASLASFCNRALANGCFFFGKRTVVTRSMRSMNEKHIQKKVHENRCLAKRTVTDFIHDTCKIEALGGFCSEIFVPRECG